MKKLVALLLTFLLVLVGCKSVKVTKIKDDIKTDNIKFKEEYKNVDKDNLYTYTTYVNVIEMIEKGTGIIYFGYPEDDRCQIVVPILNDVSKEKGVKEIEYYNIKDIKDNNTKEYKNLLKILDNYLIPDINYNKEITVPTILFIKDGNIIGIYNETSESVLSDNDDTLRKTYGELIDGIYNKEK